MAQVNTEIYRPSNRNQGYIGQIRASLSLNRGNRQNDIFSGSFRNSFVYKRHLLFGTASYVFGQTRLSDGTTDVFRRIGFLYGKYNYAIDNDSVSRWNLEAFGQNEVNEFIRLQNRNLGGVGLRFDVVEVPQKISLSIGSSIMYEFEQVKEDDRDLIYPSQTNFWRWNNYMSFTYTVNQKSRTFLSLVAYLQPAFYDINNETSFNLTENYRFLMNVNLRTAITKLLSFGMSLNYRHASFIQNFLVKDDLFLRSNLTINF
ncbi:hypothetical protein BKI52_41005 [marine bacterium AO1-C]|nr:hypothetical protein BKI52_41005 [marine bacterium AO1-C]